MSKELLLAVVAERLRRVHKLEDADVKTKGYYGLSVSGVNFYCGRVRGNKSVTLCGVRVKVSGTGVNIHEKAGECARAVVAEIPKRLEEERRRVEQSKMQQDAYDITKCLEGTAFRVDCYSEQYTMTFRHPDKGTIMAAIDYLQESGFALGSTPRHSTDEFRLAQLRRLFSESSKEDREEFLKSIGVFDQ